jgi:uncharacterized protein YoxC
MTPSEFVTFMVGGLFISIILIALFYVVFIVYLEISFRKRRR